MDEFQWRKIPSVPTVTNQKLVATAVGDVTGDGFPDWIYLTGTIQSDSPFITDIMLIITNSQHNTYQTFSLPENEGYNPTIWLGDLTDNGIKDIFITIDSGGSGGIIFAYVFSYIDGEFENIFDSIQFNEQHPYTVQYLDYYQAEVTSKSPSKRYILDLQYKGKEYINEIYNSNGTLKEPIDGWVDPISGLYPIDLARNGKYNLLAMQSIAGRYHADGLGYVENLLYWNGQQFEIDRQTVAIYGKDI